MQMNKRFQRVLETWSGKATESAKVMSLALFSSLLARPDRTFREEQYTIESRIIDFENKRSYDTSINVNR